MSSCFSSGANTFLVTAYHDLLCDVLHECKQPARPPLTLLSAFFTSLQGTSTPTASLLDSAARSFSTLYTDSGKVHKAEAWAEAWARMIDYLGSANSRTDSSDDQGISILLEVVRDGLRKALRVTESSKKVGMERVQS